MIIFFFIKMSLIILNFLTSSKDKNWITEFLLILKFAGNKSISEKAIIYTGYKNSEKSTYIIWIL